MESSKIKVTLYADLVGQPSRAIYYFLKVNKIPFEFKKTELFKGEHKSPDFLKINPHGTLPTVEITEEDGKSFIIYESISAVKYLAQVFKVDQKWYPTADLKRQAFVNQYLDWHHSNTRKILVGTLWPEVVKPIFEKTLGKTFPPMESQRDKIPTLLGFIEAELSKHTFIVDDEISIADVFLYNELIGLYFVKYDTGNYPKIEAFITNFGKCEITKEIVAPSNEFLKSSGYEKLIPLS